MELQAARQMVEELLAENGLDDWKFVFDQSLVQFGACWDAKKQIQLSAPITQLNDVATVRETVLHEVAHALAGAGAGHGWLWRQWCLRLGISPNRCYDEAVKTPEKRWAGVCQACQEVVIERQELGKAMRAKQLSHSACGGGQYDDRAAIVWVDRRAQ